MNITDALFCSVQTYPGGSAALAPRLDMSEHSLRHKVSPTYAGAHVSPEEMVAIQVLTRDLRPLHAHATQLNCMVLPLAMPIDDAECAYKAAATIKEFGEFVTQVSLGMSDNTITANELRRIERSYAEMLAAGSSLVALLSRMHQAGKPKAERGRK